MKMKIPMLLLLVLLLNGIMFWAGVALLLGKISLPNEFSELNPLMAAMLFLLSFMPSFLAPRN